MTYPIILGKPRLLSRCRRLCQTEFLQYSRLLCIHAKMEVVEQTESLYRIGDGYLSVFDANQIVAIGLLAAVSHVR